MKFIGPSNHIKSKIKVKKPIIDVDVVRSIIGAHVAFNGDVEKVALWFRTDNLNFGGVSPDFLIQCGRAKKVWQMVDAAVSESKPLKPRRQTSRRSLENEPQE